MKTKASSKQSAGLLLYRRKDGIEVLLGHPGGPFWRNKDLGSWSIPKGMIAAGETPLTAAKREFAEETGHSLQGTPLGLGEARQPGGKVVHVWAVEGDWDTAGLISNNFEMEWPPRSGRLEKFPELDRAAWFRSLDLQPVFSAGAGQVLTIGTLRHNALKAPALRFREELRAACLTMAAERDELVARQDFLEPLLAFEQRETA